jgi:TNF receptor-associated protein 1
MASLASLAGLTARNHARLATAAATTSRSTLTTWRASSVLSSSFSSPWGVSSSTATAMTAATTTTNPRFFSTTTNAGAAAGGTAADSDSDNNDSDDSAVPKEKASQSMEFQAETKQLLDIVTHSLYTDKEVFLRELISNASDACEKLRHLQQQSQSGVDIVAEGSEVLPLEIRIDLDEVTSTITISDTGIGMTREDMISNLGTIARSGSKNFLAELQSQESGDGSSGSGMDIARGIIGKFGVGFYSVFMIANKVEVRSRPAYSEEPATVWTSEGTGSFEVAPLSDDVRQDRGTSIIIHLDSDYWHYCDETKLKEILNKYSNFVQFPILVNGLRVNTVQAVWSMDPKEVEYDTYVDFYKYIANAIDNPLDILHFRAEVPLDLKALFYIPSFHSEKYGMDRMEPGISLYSRKVLIESKCADIVPDWMRFVKGVVDSEDLPLSISREKTQDSALMGKLSKVLTRKFIAHLEKMAK